MKNLSFALGKEFDQKRIKKISLEVFENIGKNAADVFRLKRYNWEKMKRMVKSKGLEYFDHAYKKGNGLIGLTGHIGNFELLAAYLSLKGYKISVVGREVYDPKLDKLLVESRERMGLEYISSTDDVRRIISSLHQGKAVGILADQDSRRVKGVFVDFFGRKAKTPIGPALIHLKYGSPLIPIAILRSGKYNYRIIVKKPIAFEPTGEREKDLVKITQLYTRELEVIIRENPSQWVWMHKRWKSRPD
ncbi:MAG: hypothetical protein AMS26_06400 [Bacteroides sp. SM23_62]|nr:MAG: hypothetical protein AMS26_06400 [Bacteroides sp. SM23_62]